MKSLFFLTTFFALFNFNISFSEDIKSLEPVSRNTVLGVTYTHPIFRSAGAVSITSGMYELSGIFRINDKLRMAVNLPFSRYSINSWNSDYSQTESGLGNISLGIKYLISDFQNKTFSLYLFLPTSSKNQFDANIISAGSNIWDLHKYLLDYLTVYLNFTLNEFSESNFYYGFGFSDRLMIPTGRGDAEDMIDYFITGGYDKINSVGAEIQIAGIFDFSSNAPDLADKFLHLLKCGFTYHSNSAKSKMFFIVPFNESYSELIKSLIGLEFQFNLK
jgi:hypothetical protein